MFRRSNHLDALPLTLACICFLASNSLAQESGPQFRYDPNQALDFDADPTGTPRRGVSPDGTMRVTTASQKIRVLSIPGGKVLHEFPTPHFAMAPTFSPDQKQIVYADCTGNLACESVVYVRDLATGDQATLGSCYGVTLQFAFSGDGKRLAVLSMYGPIMAMIPQQKFKKPIAGEIAVFNLKTERELMHLAYRGKGLDTKNKSYTEAPIRIALDHSGETLLATAKSGVVKVVDVQTHTQQFSVNASFKDTITVK